MISLIYSHFFKVLKNAGTNLAFFSTIRAFSQKFVVTQHTLHRLYLHNTFYPSDESNETNIT